MTTMTHTPRSALFPVVLTARLGVLDRLLTLYSIHNERRALAQMDASRLSDIGVSRSAARAESRRAAWDAPERWTR
jgi:uncharacterized protein YjiS (DUF1127 family)